MLDYLLPENQWREIACVEFLFHGFDLELDEVYAVIQHTGDPCGLACEQVVHKGMPVHGVLLAPLLVDVGIASPACEYRKGQVQNGCSKGSGTVGVCPRRPTVGQAGQR